MIDAYTGDEENDPMWFFSPLDIEELHRRINQLLYKSYKNQITEILLYLRDEK